MNEERGALAAGIVGIVGAVITIALIVDRELPTGTLALVGLAVLVVAGWLIRRARNCRPKTPRRRT